MISIIINHLEDSSKSITKKMTPKHCQSITVPRFMLLLAISLIPTVTLWPIIIRRMCETYPHTQNYAIHITNREVLRERVSCDDLTASQEEWKACWGMFLKHHSAVGGCLLASTESVLSRHCCFFLLFIIFFTLLLSHYMLPLVLAAAMEAPDRQKANICWCSQGILQNYQVHLSLIHWVPQVWKVHPT